MADDIQFEILEDGTISVKTSDISDVNHISADSLLDELAAALGGERKRTRREHPFMKNKKVIRGGHIVKMRR